MLLGYKLRVHMLRAMCCSPPSEEPTSSRHGCDGSSLLNCFFLVAALTRTHPNSRKGTTCSLYVERRLLLYVVSADLGRTAVLDVWWGKGQRRIRAHSRARLCDRKWNGAVPSMKAARCGSYVGW